MAVSYLTLAPASERGGLASRILSALVSAYRQRLQYEVDHHTKPSERGAAELEHRLSWRFGVPVR